MTSESRGLREAKTQEGGGVLEGEAGKQESVRPRSSSPATL